MIIFEPLFAATAEIRKEARAQLERSRNKHAAARLEWAADLVEHAVRNLGQQTASYAESATCSVWTHGTIKTKVSAGELTNVGTRADPRLSVEDLVVRVGDILPAASPHLYALPDAESPGEGPSGDDVSPASTAAPTGAVSRLLEAA